jgi:hypothetical protein
MRAGDPLYRIHAGTQTGLDFARDLAADSSGYELR